MSQPLQVLSSSVLALARGGGRRQTRGRERTGRRAASRRLVLSLPHPLPNSHLACPAAAQAPRQGCSATRTWMPGRGCPARRTAGWRRTWREKYEWRGLGPVRRLFRFTRTFPALAAPLPSFLRARPVPGSLPPLATLSMVDYTDLSYADLQAACKQRGLPARGCVDDVCFRLTECALFLPFSLSLPAPPLSPPPRPQEEDRHDRCPGGRGWRQEGRPQGERLIVFCQRMGREPAACARPCPPCVQEGGGGADMACAAAPTHARHPTHTSRRGPGIGSHAGRHTNAGDRLLTLFPSFSLPTQIKGHGRARQTRLPPPLGLQGPPPPGGRHRHGDRKSVV